MPVLEYDFWLREEARYVLFQVKYLNFLFCLSFCLYLLFAICNCFCWMSFDVMRAVLCYVYVQIKQNHSHFAMCRAAMQASNNNNNNK